MTGLLDLVPAVVMAAAALVFGYSLGWIRGQRAGTARALRGCMRCVAETMRDIDPEGGRGNMAGPGA